MGYREDMKLSVSLSDDDVAFVDEYSREHAVTSRSAVIQRALELLRAHQLGADYAAAWQEWFDDPDEAAWDATAADGLVRQRDARAPR